MQNLAHVSHTPWNCWLEGGPKGLSESRHLHAQLFEECSLHLPKNAPWANKGVLEEQVPVAPKQVPVAPKQVPVAPKQVPVAPKQVPVAPEAEAPEEAKSSPPGGPGGGEI